MASVLIIFVHPVLEKSRVHAALLNAAVSVSGVTVHDLYDRYPDFDIDVEREKNLLLAHDIIIWQHPLYWYSAPPLLKQWQDLVLEHGWAYGKQGTALAGKKLFQVISSGGSLEGYQHGGYNKRPIREYLIPFERTAELCRMAYWPPYWVHGVHRMDRVQVEGHAVHYRRLLTSLTGEFFSEADIESLELMNHLMPQSISG